jgi:hypothetical protein
VTPAEYAAAWERAIAHAVLSVSVSAAIAIGVATAAYRGRRDR